MCLTCLVDFSLLDNQLLKLDLITNKHMVQNQDANSLGTTHLVVCCYLDFPLNYNEKTASLLFICFGTDLLGLSGYMDTWIHVSGVQNFN